MSEAPAPPELKHLARVYKGRVFEVTVDRVAFADGREVQMDCVRHPGSVVLLPMTAADRLLLVRQYRYVVDRWLWELPAGTRDPNESLEAAARRECHEEVGRIAATAERLSSFFPSPGFCDEEMHFFKLTGLREPGAGDPPAHADPDELLEVAEFEVADVRRMLAAGEIADMKTAIGIGLLANPDART